MRNIVKLILICQIKDEFIPQLIPLIWIISTFLIRFMLIIIINIFFYTRTNILCIRFRNESLIYKNYLW
jgi:hypothetical protein